MPVRKIKAGGVNVSVQNFIGEDGILFYDSNTGDLRLSDGHTPGGLPLTTATNIATTSTLGQIKVDGVTITVDQYGVISAPAGAGETDPIFSTSTAAGIASSDVSNWNTAYSWGNHADAGYLTAINWSSVNQNIIPSDDLTYDLGSTSSQWRSLYVGTSTVYFGGIPFTVSADGTISVGGNAVVATTGVTSITAGTGTAISSSTGAVTIWATGGGSAFDQNLNTTDSVVFAQITATNSLRINSTEIALGQDAGATGPQGAGAVAVGAGAGQINQGPGSIAIGNVAGNTNQGIGSLGIGSAAGGDNQGDGAIAIGNTAGMSNQGNYAIAIGAGAGATNQPANSIIINANNAVDLDAAVSGLFINPVRADASNTNKVVYYNTSTKELTYADVVSAGEGIATTSTLINGTYTLSLTSLGVAEFPGLLKIKSVAPEAPATGTEIIQESGIISLVAGGDGHFLLSGWAQNYNGPGNVAYTDYNYDSGSVRIVTGNNVGTLHTWKFDDSGVLTLPNNTSTIKTEVFSNFGTDFPSIVLTPDPAFDQGQGLRIYAGFSEAGHLHLTASTSTTDLFFGNDNQYVKLAADGHVEISPLAGLRLWGSGVMSNAYIYMPSQEESTTTSLLVANYGDAGVLIQTGNGSPPNNWLFQNNGILRLPGTATLYADANDNAGLVLYDTSNNERAQLAAIGDVNIRADSSGTGVEWTFGVDGNLTLPGGDVTLGTNTGFLNIDTLNGGELAMNDGTGNVGSVGLEPGSAFITIDDGSGTKIWNFTPDGTLTVPNYIQFKDGSFIGDEGGASPPVFRIDAPLGLGINFTTDSDITGANNVWSLGIDGSLTFPDGTTSTGATVYVPYDTTSSYDITTVFDLSGGEGGPYVPLSFKVQGNRIVLPNGNGFIQSGNGIWALDSSNYEFAFPNGSRFTYGAEGSNIANTGSIRVEIIKSELEHNDPDFTIRINETDKNWVFDSNGNLTVPNYIYFKDGSFIGDEGGESPPAFRINAPLGVGINFTTDIGGTNNVWSLGIDGSLTFPDSTVQTTAYTRGLTTFEIDATTTATTGLAGADTIVIKPAVGYLGSDTQTLEFTDRDVAGMRTLMINASTLCTVNFDFVSMGFGPIPVAPATVMEVIYIGDGDWYIISERAI